MVLIGLILETIEDKTRILESVWENTENDTKKKGHVAKPRPKLTEKELISEKGIPALKAKFENYRFPEDADPVCEILRDVISKK